MQKLKNNEARPKFAGSYKKKRAYLSEDLLQLVNISIEIPKLLKLFKSFLKSVLGFLVK